MKKIIKKLGVIGLALAVLIPFMDLPKVKAANDDCQYHLQNYLFLDVNQFSYGNFLEGYTSSNGYRTVTQFPFEFPDNAVVLNYEYNNIDNGDSDTFVAAYDGTSKLSQNASRFYSGTRLYGQSFVKTNTVGKYSTNTILVHGQWARVDDNFRAIDSDWGGLGDKNVFKNHILQNTVLKELMDVKLYQGSYSRGGTFPNAIGDEISADLFNKLIGEVNKENNGGEYDNTLLSWDETDQVYFLPIGIARKMNNVDSTLSNAVFGYNTGGTVFIFGETSADSGASVNNKASKTTKSYENYKAWINAKKTNSSLACNDSSVNYCYEAGSVSEDSFKNDPKSSAGVDLDVYGNYYWPFVLNVEYKTCGNAGDPTEGNWNLKYDANADGNPVNNLPDEVTNIALNTTVDVAEGPTRDGWTFKKWCTNPNGSGQCVNAGGKITSDKSKTVILYAQWGQTGTTTNGKTGIVSYIISFVAVGAIAGGIYYVSKKKNLFKQI